MAVHQLQKTKAPASFGAFRTKQNEKTFSPDADSGTRSGRLQLVLPERSIERLEAIKEATEATSYAEVLRHSLRIYEGLLAERDEGNELVIRRKDGTEEVIPLRFFIR